MVLGDNIFYGGGLTSMLKTAVDNAHAGKATIFGYYVDDPERFGIMDFDEEWNILSVEEKPQKPKSNYCITGLYFYPSGVAEKAKQVRPSSRGELEITALNDMYLKEKKPAPEEIAFRKGWISKEQLVASAEMYGNSPYGEHLRKVADGRLKY